MALGLYEGRVLGTEPWTDKKTGLKTWNTNIAIGSDVYRVPGAGFEIMQPVFVLGEIRRYENRTYFADGVQVWERAETATLLSLTSGKSSASASPLASAPPSPDRTSANGSQAAATGSR